MSLLGPAASILLRALVLTTLLLAATAAAAVFTTAFVPVVDDDHRDVVNTTTMFANGSATSSSSPGAENWEMYYCFLCTGRDLLLIHYCPIYWDECQLICWNAIPDAPAPPAPVPPSPPVGSAAAHLTTAATAARGNDDECYVMKLYMSGRYVIVQRMDCDGTTRCFLSCGGGELAGGQKVAVGAATAAVPATTTMTAAAMQKGSFVSSEVCGTQVNALRAPPSSAGVVVVVPAGGAH